jgi:O-antigen/teichoic acid export membrane protein
MDRNEKFVLLKNAVANVGRGSAAAFVAILLPPFLTRMMTSEAFGAWSLVIQLSAFVGYFDFGIQTAIGRFIAHTGESKDAEHRDRIVSTGAAALATAGFLGLVGSVGLALFLSNVFHQVPHFLLRDSSFALLLVGGSLAIGLPCSLFNGVFVGLQRYDIPAAVIGGSRLVSGLFLVLVVRHGGGLVQMGAVVAAVNLVSYGLQYTFYRRMAPRMRFSSHLVCWRAGRELFDYCLSLSIWSFAMLLVSGLDVSLVGYFEFEKVAYYSVAATLIVFLAGVQFALFNVMIPSTAVMQVRGSSTQLGQVMITATRYGTFVLLLMGLPLIVAAKSILSVWVGPKYAVEGARILQVLTAANMIRLSAVPYVMTLIGTGQQRLVKLTPLLEGVSNLIVSVFGGLFFGAFGVAIGTLIGGVVGALGNLIYNMPRTNEINFRTTDYLRDGLLRPLICALPLVSVGLTFHLSALSLHTVGYASIGAAVAATLVLLWFCGLMDTEREKLRELLFLTEGQRGAVVPGRKYTHPTNSSAEQTAQRHHSL